MQVIDPILVLRLGGGFTGDKYIIILYNVYMYLSFFSMYKILYKI